MSVSEGVRFIARAGESVFGRFREAISRADVRRALLALGIAAASLAFSFYLWGPNLQARWWVIDDHEIVKFMGSDGRLTLAEIPATWLKTEVGSWGRAQRYRPAYYGLRLFEAWAWGKSTSVWYLTRLLIFAFWIFILWWLLQKGFGFFYGLFMVIVLADYAFWADIFAHLGPGESYAVLGTSLFALGFVRTLQNLNAAPAPIPEREHMLDAVCLCAGALVAMGSKENFLFLVVPALFLAAYAGWKKQLERWLLISAAVILIFGLVVGAEIAIALSAIGKDIYANDVSTVSRTMVLLSQLPLAEKRFGLAVWPGVLFAVFILGAVLTVYLARGRAQATRVAKRLLFLAVSTASAFLLYLAQVVFYNGQWPVGNRYDFPGVLMIPLFYLGALSMIFTSLEAIGIGRIPLHAGKLLVVLFVFVTLQPVNDPLKNDPHRIPWLAILGNLAKHKPAEYFQPNLLEDEPLRTFHAIRKVSESNRFLTVQFSRRIDEITSLCLAHPSLPLVFESTGTKDYESIASVRRFLIANQVRNAMFLRLTGYAPATAKRDLDGFIVRQLMDISRAGGPPGDPTWGFKPLAQLNKTGKARIVIEFAEMGNVIPRLAVDR